jgi:hypothetical protein
MFKYWLLVFGQGGGFGFWFLVFGFWFPQSKKSYPSLFFLKPQPSTKPAAPTNA